MFLLRNSFFFQLCFFIFFTSPLYSELLKNKKFPDSNKLLNVNVGLSTLSAPKYEGSSKSVSRIMPFFNLKYKARKYLSMEVKMEHRAPRAHILDLEINMLRLPGCLLV